MTLWAKFEEWMRFDNLDVYDDSLSGAFTIGYRFINDEFENWTRRFNKFKEGRNSAYEGCKNMIPDIVEPLVEKLELNTSSTTFVPALTSEECIASPSGILSWIAGVCAERSTGNFEREAIGKNPHEPLHKAGSAGKRSQILDEANYHSVSIDAENAIIFDDFITRGETLSHIARAIRRSNMEIKNIYGIALGKNERRGYYLQARSNDHVSVDWADLWEEGARGH